MRAREQTLHPRPALQGAACLLDSQETCFALQDCNIWNAPIKREFMNNISMIDNYTRISMAARRGIASTLPSTSLPKLNGER
jgi:hypothetical protein